MPYRFVHTADIHLDSPLESLALRNSELAGLIGNATRKSFVRIIDLCLEEEVDALIIAGDLYDGSQTSMKTAIFLAEQLQRLDRAGMDVYVVRGNHDAESRITNELVLPGRVKVFKSSAGIEHSSRSGNARPIAIHGLSFARPHAPESLLRKYKAPIDGAVNIGIMHTSLSGTLGHDVYAPCKADDLHASGFQYWALGHIHKRSVIEGRTVIVMPGIPQGRDINESGPKSVSLVTVGDDGSVRVEERFTSVAQFERVPVDASDSACWDDLVRKIQHSLEEAQKQIRSDHLVARLTVSGKSAMAWQLRRDFDRLQGEAEFRAASLGNCWIDKVEVACYPDGVLQTQKDGSVDPVLELKSLMDTETLDSEAFQTEFARIAEELSAQLPQECRDAFGSTEAESLRRLAELAHEGAEDVLASLSAERSQ